MHNFVMETWTCCLVSILDLIENPISEFRNYICYGTEIYRSPHFIVESCSGSGDRQLFELFVMV